MSQFLRQYESQSTKRSYQTGLRLFFESVYPELKNELEKKRKELEEALGKTIKFVPPEIILEYLDIYSSRYLTEDRDHREDIFNFKDSLKDKAPGSRTLRISSVRAFLDDNGINFPRRFFKNLNGKVNEPITWEKVPSNEELKRIIEYLPMQGKALALVLSSSGMRVGESVQIKLCDIDLKRDPVRIKVRTENTKTGKRRITFISPEAKEAVNEWLKYREQYLARAINRTQIEFRKDKTDNLFPFTADNFNMIWKNALTKAQLLEIDSKTKRVTMRPHNLRKYFRLRVGRYGRDEAEALMGHQAGLNKVYANFDGAEERLEKVYNQSIPDLSIYGRTIQVAQIDEETKTEIAELKHKVDILVQERAVNQAELRLLKDRVNEWDEYKKRILAMEKEVFGKREAQLRKDWEEAQPTEDDLHDSYCQKTKTRE